ncbi:MAG: family 20 glycosylhydrolase [Chitinophagia bacterium]
MKKISGFLLCIMCFQIINAQTTTPLTQLIPKPISIKEASGLFTFYKNTSIEAAPALLNAKKLLQSQLINYNFSSSKNSSKIIFLQANTKDPIAKEGYAINITPNTISITAKNIQAALLATNTLVQIQLLQNNAQQIPCGSIIDSPRFEYRGMHLDVSRNFYPVSFIKKYLDIMALYKFNTFHWHLTDGPGWRLQINSYPKLTSMSAFRTHNDWKSWWNSDRKYLSEGDPNAYGGYYTQEQAKDIVAYAGARGITVIPEIEMPGHSEEVLAAYPELSCSGKPYVNDVFCAGNEASFVFIEKVLTEVMAIFPSKYIHIGGDEAGKGAWKKCPKCQLRMKDNSLKSEEELQSYLVKRVEKFLNKNNRNLLGWDEILEGGLSPNATVMSWRGEQGGIQAAMENHDVIMTPGGETYFDAYQNVPSTQPEAIGGYLPMKRVYNYNPVPAVLPKDKQKFIKGVQGQLWTEYIPTTYHLEYMSFPRAIALSEVGWALNENKNFSNFTQRLQSHYLLLQKLNVNYYHPSTIVEVFSSPDMKEQKNKISFSSEIFNANIRYTLDGSTPNINSIKYDQPFYVGGEVTIKASVISNDGVVHDPTIYYSNYHKAIGKKVKFNTLWDKSYPAQTESTLTNGIIGSITYSDKQWLGYLIDFDVVVDMENVTPVNKIGLRFMQYVGAGVYMPKSVSYSFSNDGINFTNPIKVDNNIPDTDKKLSFKTFESQLSNISARFIRVQADNSRRQFLFTDEIMVN